MTTNISLARLKLLAAISCVLILIPCIIWGLWIYSFNTQANQADRVAMYKSFFPASLNGPATLSLVSLLCCVITIVFSLIAWNRKTQALRSLSIIILVLAGGIAMLTLFSLL